MLRIEAFSGSVGETMSFTDVADPWADFSRDLCNEPELPFLIMLELLEVPLLFEFSVDNKIQINFNDSFEAINLNNFDDLPDSIRFFK